MPIPFLNSIKLNKNQVEDFCVFNYSGDPTLSSGADFGYLWLNTSATPKVLKFWDGTNYRTLIDSTTISTSTAGTANDLSGGVAGSLPYQQGVGDTTFLGIGSSGYILTSTGSAPQWSASIPSTSVSGLAASATTDTTNASNISSGTLGLARLSLASGQFYVGDGSNNPAATAKSSIPLSGFGNAAADINIGGFKITNSGTIGSGDADSTVATKGYVDSVAQGLDVKASCLVATTADITLASPGAVTIDGIYSATDFTAGTTRILVKDQSAPAENGIYIWQGPSSAMTRSADANTWDELVGAFTFVERGTANADSGWVCTVNAGGTLGSTAVTWVKFSQAGSYTAGNGIVQSGTSFNFAQSTAYTAGQIPFASSTTAMGFNANLHWDNSNNRLGIGTATPRVSLDVASGEIYSSGQITWGGSSPTANQGFLSYTGGNAAIGSAGATALLLYTNSSERLRIASDGVCTWSNVGGVAGTAMTLNGTGLGVGMSPSAILSAQKSSATQATGLILRNPNGTNGSSISLDFEASSGTSGTEGALAARISGRREGAGTTGALDFFTNANGTLGTAKMVLNSSGNVGIGTATPNYKLHILNDGGSAHAVRIYGTGANASYLALNASNTDTGIIAGGSSAVPINFYTGGTLRATIDSSGNLGLGVTPSARLHTYISDGGTNNLVEIARLQRATTGTAAVGFGQYLRFDLERGDGANEVAGFIGTKWSNATAGVTKGDLIFGGSDNGALTTAMTLEASGNLRVGAAAAAGVLTVTNSTTNTSIGLINLSGFANTNTNSIDFYLDNSNSGVVTHGVIGCINTAATANRYGELFFKTANAAAPVTRIRIKAQGQLNLVPISADPAGPEAGDVYYNSTSNTLKWYGTAWNTLPRKYVVQLSDGSVTVLGNAYTITHNLGSQDVTVSIRRTTDNAVVQADVVMPAGGNTVTVTFAAAITAAQFYVTVIG